MNHLIPTLITGFQENATSSALNVVWRAHIQILGKTGVVLDLSKAFPSDSGVEESCSPSLGMMAILPPQRMLAESME